MHHEQKKQIPTVKQQYLAIIKRDLEIGHARLAHEKTRNVQPKVA